jgi:hypothetical protein
VTTTEPDGASWREWSEWWAHQRPWTWIALFGIGIATILLHIQTWMWSAFSLAAVLAIVINGWRHDATLCARCAAKTPLNPQPVVARARWALWLHHQNNWAAVIAIALIISRDYVPKPVDAAIVVALFVGVSLFNAVALRHRPLQRWCPYCPRWGGGDDGPRETTPVGPPQPSGVKQA